MLALTMALHFGAPDDGSGWAFEEEFFCCEIEIESDSILNWRASGAMVLKCFEVFGAVSFSCAFAELILIGDVGAEVVIALISDFCL